MGGRGASSLLGREGSTSDCDVFEYPGNDVSDAHGAGVREDLRIAYLYCKIFL